MKIIGITGPSGSGKSVLCRFLSENGVFCIDADEVYHSLLVPPSECFDAIRRAFGDGVFGADGGLDRAALASLVFNDAQKLELLNSTVLEYVLAKIREIIADYREQGAKTVAVDAPTLIESGFDKECDIVVSVIAPPEERKERIIERDTISEQRASERIKAQKSDEFYITHSDVVLQNDGTTEQLKRAVESLLGRLMEEGDDA